MHCESEASFLSCKVCGALRVESVRAAKRPRVGIEGGGRGKKKARDSNAEATGKGKCNPKLPSAFDRLMDNNSDFLKLPRYKGRGDRNFRDVPSPEELRRLCPVALQKKALPAKLAKRLLKELIDCDAGGSGVFKRGTWRVQGKTHATPRTVRSPRVFL